MFPRLALRFTRVIPIEKAEILSGNTEKVKKIIDLTTGELKIGLDLVPWSMPISGYDTDLRPLAIIPEVKNWFTKIHKEFPYFPIFLSNFSIKPYMLCVSNLQVVGSGRRGDISDEEQAQIDIAVKAYEKLNPGKGESFREQKEGAFVYSADPNEIENLCSEINFTALAYLNAQKIDGEKQRAITAKTMARIKSAIESDR